MDPSSPATSSELAGFESASSEPAASSKSRPENTPSSTPSSKKKLHRNDHQISVNAVQLRSFSIANGTAMLPQQSFPSTAPEP
jgi:hypothetical protein